MTREEAIKELKLIAQVTMWNDRREAVEMAIEALSAEVVHIETYRELYEKYVELKHALAEAVQMVRCKDCK